MHKHGLCCCAVVHLSVSYVYFGKMSKFVFIFFQHRVATPFWFFRTERYGKYSDGDPLKSQFLTNIWLLGSMTAGVSSLVSSFNCGVKFIITAVADDECHLVCDCKARRRFYQLTGRGRPKRKNRIVCIGN